MGYAKDSGLLSEIHYDQFYAIIEPYIIIIIIILWS